jgi:hypothetical protein
VCILLVFLTYHIASYIPLYCQHYINLKNWHCRWVFLGELILACAFINDGFYNGQVQINPLIVKIDTHVLEISLCSWAQFTAKFISLLLKELYKIHIKQPTNQCSKQLAKKPTINRPITNQPTNQPTDWPTDGPNNRPTNQLIINIINSTMHSPSLEADRFLPLYWTQSDMTFYQAPVTSHCPDQVSPVYALQQFRKHFHIFFPSTPLSSKWAPSRRSPHQNLVRTPTVGHTNHMNLQIVNARMTSQFLHEKEIELTSSYNCVPEP